MGYLNKYLLELTGGSTKGAGTAAAAVQLINHHRPHAVLCTSVGALIALPLALSTHAQYKYLQRTVLEETAAVTMQKIFTVPAFNKKGKVTLRALWRALIGRNSLGLQDTTHYIKQFITAKMFNIYKSGVFPAIYVSVTNYYTGHLEYINLKHVSYADAVRWIEASARMPVFTQPVIINGTAYYDGGIIDKSGSDYAKPILIEQGMQEVVSIYHHPREIAKAPHRIPPNITAAAARYMQITQQQQSLNEVKLMQATCEQLNIKHYPLYIKNYMQSFYDTAPHRLQRMQQAAAAAGQAFVQQLQG